jgi:hypothetical protein
MSKHLTLAAAVALACAGCRGARGLYPVSGKVTYQGEPAAGAYVFFRQPGADPVSAPVIMGVVKEDGSFIVYSGEHEGAAPGDYAVLIQWRQGANPGAGARHERPPDRLGGRYADPEHPRLQAAVKAEANHLPPFELVD